MLWVSMRKEGILCGAESATWKQTKKFVLFAVLKPLTTFRPKFTGARNARHQLSTTQMLLTRASARFAGKRLATWHKIFARFSQKNGCSWPCCLTAIRMSLCRNLSGRRTAGIMLVTSLSPSLPLCFRQQTPIRLDRRLRNL